MIRLVTIATLLACAACGSIVDPGETPDPWLSLEAGQGVTRDLPAAVARPEVRPGPSGGALFVPASAPIATGVPYRFSLGHCGLMSPVDVDGSFWVAIAGVTAGGRPLDLESDAEMINATSGVIVVIGDEARFRTESGSVVRFERHPGEREFQMCL